ncbi:dienelactone hydrolase family protein [Bacillus sp. YC2]|uniref:alpha/beta hydrolase family protein n=1 Tax=Bacillus sp. YC2 TaxID=2861287 RepID=UPI001CA726A2|nr:dienelactone hydrolase family protein [Bacillus sp. YC2]MBY8912053.1 dienelactone hydrolase family protein [Bacillus sp. YC2]
MKELKNRENAQFSAGFEFMHIKHDHDEITIPTMMMYPAHTEEKAEQIGPYQLKIAKDAPLANGTFPLVIISHGDGSTPFAYRTIAQFLARNGFIAVIPQHPFNNREDNTLSGTEENLRNRPQQIYTVIDWIVKKSRYSSSIKSNAICLIGHSMGGYTALAIAGGVPTSFPHESSDHKPHELHIVHDDRVQSIILLAPAAGWFREKGALQKADIPIFMITGEKDTITPSFHAEFVLKGIFDQNKIHHKVVKNGGHFSFLSPFPDHMQNEAFPPSQDPVGFNREEYHKELQADILDFLHRTL